MGKYSNCKLNMYFWSFAVVVFSTVEHIVVAWFNPRDIVGYRKVKEYGWTNDDVAVKENENE